MKTPRRSLGKIPSSLKQIPLGVDLVEIKKTKAFYRLHRSRLNSFLSRYEMGLVQKSKKPVRALAEILAAKEALYKAQVTGGRRSGGFETLRLTRAILKEKIVFIKNKRFAVALVVPCAGKS